MSSPGSISNCQRHIPDVAGFYLIYIIFDNFLLDLSGGQFKVFVPISSDEAFASYTGVVAALLLLSIALLGHLLGFHIYLSKCLACTLHLVPPEYSVSVPYD